MLTAELRTHRKTQTAERLASEIWAQGPNGGWVFASETGGPTDPRADNRDFKKLCEVAKIPPRRLHDLRHSAATMMLDNDLDLKTVGQLLGHSQLAHTGRYTHVLADRKSVALSGSTRLSFALGAPTPKQEVAQQVSSWHMSSQTQQAPASAVTGPTKRGSYTFRCLSTAEYCYQNCYQTGSALAKLGQIPGQTGCAPGGVTRWG